MHVVSHLLAHHRPRSRKNRVTNTATSSDPKKMVDGKQPCAKGDEQLTHPFVVEQGIEATSTNDRIVLPYKQRPSYALLVQLGVA